MKRTKEWWSSLTKSERSELYWLERAGSTQSSYIPDDCSECGYCGVPHLGSGLCTLCYNSLIKILDKADKNISALCEKDGTL